MGRDGSYMGAFVFYGAVGRTFTRYEQRLLQTAMRQIAASLTGARKNTRELDRLQSMLHSSAIGVLLGRIEVGIHGAHSQGELCQAIVTQLRRIGLLSALLLCDDDERLQMQAHTLSVMAQHILRNTLGVNIDELAIALETQPWLARLSALGLPVVLRHVRRQASQWLPQVDDALLQRIFLFVGLTPRAELVLVPLVSQGRVHGVRIVWASRAPRSATGTAHVWHAYTKTAANDARHAS